MARINQLSQGQNMLDVWRQGRTRNDAYRGSGHHPWRVVLARWVDTDPSRHAWWARPMVPNLLISRHPWRWVYIQYMTHAVERITYMTHAVAFATKTFLRNVLAQRNYEYCTTQELSSSTFHDFPGRDLFRVLKRSPISQLHALGLRWSCSDGKARSNTTWLRRRLHPHCGVSLLQSLCRALGQTEASYNFKVLARPGRDSNHAEQRPTSHEASALATWQQVRPKD